MTSVSESEQLRLIFEHNPVPLFIIGVGYSRSMMVNEAASRMLGWSVEEIESMSPSDIVLPEDRSILDEAFDTTEDLIRHIGAVRLRTSGGRIIVAEITIHRTHIGYEQVLIVSAVDITTSVEVEDALRESETRLALALEASSDGIWDWNVTTGEVYYSAQWGNMLGYAPSEIRHHISTWESLVHPNDVANAWRSFDEHAKSGAPSIEVENRMRRKDGSWATILVRAKIVERTPDGAPRRIVGTHTDVSERRESERALVRQADILDTVLSNIPIMIAILRPGEDFDYVNRAWVEKLGWPLSKMNGKDVLGSLYPDPSYRAEAIAFMLSASDEWRDWKVMTRDGTELLTAWSYVSLADGRLIGIGQDVTDRRAAEAEREQLQAQLLQTQKLESLGVLAGGVAHDFNNLLVGMLTNASLAEDMLTEDSPTLPLVTDIRIAATRAADLTRQLLAYAGRGRFRVEPINISHLAEEMSILLRAVVSRSATLRTELAEELNAVEIDATQMRQVVMNLITNASESLGDKSGEIVVRTGEIDVDEDFAAKSIGAKDFSSGRYVYVEVEDNGHGMDQTVLSRIFDPFFTTRFTGRGLGLAATLGIVASHGGAVHIESTPDVGTRVRVLLPPISVAKSVDSQNSVRADNRWYGSGDILLADDEAAVRNVAASALERLGFSVEHCADGYEAVDRFAADPDRWRLVVLDLAMPRLGGDEALGMIRSIRSSVPVIIYSGYNVSELQDRLRNTPNLVFLQKPFNAARLEESVRKSLTV